LHTLPSLDTDPEFCKNIHMKKLNLFFAVSLFTLSVHSAPTPVLSFKAGQESYDVDKIADGFDGIWAMEFLDTSKMIFNEINGQISTLDLKTGVTRQLKNLPVVYVSGQGGLLDIAVDPDFKKNNFIYVTYSKKVGSKQTTAMARSKLNLATETFGTWEDLYVGQPAFDTTHHYGSRIAFDYEGHIFVSQGERGQADLAQSLEANNGKVMRLNMDGSIPSDNPFVNTPRARKEIWSYGHRNPQGLYYDRATKTLYEQEHGPKGGDEINVVVKGKNYGWPIVTFGREYSGQTWRTGETQRPGLQQAVKIFVPSIAPSSLLVYRGDTLKLFTDKFVSGSLALQHLNVVAIKESYTACEDRLLLKLDERVRDVKQGPDGLVYVSSDNGRIYVIKQSKK
jgi:glucose/arabinose dehydrogenase